MNAPRHITFNSQKFKVVTPSFGKGGQGTVHKIRQCDGGHHLAIAKELPREPNTERRIDKLIELGIGLEIPFIAAPLAMTPARRKQSIYYLAPFSTGISLEEDRPRPFPELFEMAIVLAATWENLEHRGIAHGDIAPANVLVRDDGTIDLIDFDNYVLADGSVPPPTMIGQHPMIAPELRAARNAKKSLAPDLMSDRFSWAVLFNILLLGRYPADGLATTPSKLDQVLSTGDWPEDLRSPAQGETPISALGENLQKIFRQSFSTSPLRRPDSETWRRTLTDGMNRLHVHGCGNAFVIDPGENRCPVCGDVYESKSARFKLIAKNLITGRETSFDLPDGTPVFLGRDTLPGASPYVSSRHVRIHREGKILHIKQVGRNSTRVALSGNNEVFKLVIFHENLLSPHLKDAVFTLGDMSLKIRIAQSGSGT